LEVRVALSVIGAGFGRTGTHSLKLALERLGLGPCHHMSDVIASPEQTALWRAAARGEPIDWEVAYAGYKSAVDWPTAYYWRELAEYYPDAKIILTVRNSEEWYKSARNTIFGTMRADANPASFGVMVIANKIFGGRPEDETHAIEVLEKHNAEVMRTIEPDRLLIYQISEGWPKLCGFLGVPVPAEPFPLSNTTPEFQARMKR
jgi:hypothetical protein